MEKSRNLETLIKLSLDFRTSGLELQELIISQNLLIFYDIYDRIKEFNKSLNLFQSKENNKKIIEYHFSQKFLLKEEIKLGIKFQSLIIKHPWKLKRKNLGVRNKNLWPSLNPFNIFQKKTSCKIPIISYPQEPNTLISKHKQNFKQRRKCLEEINFKSLGRPLPFKRKGKEILLINETPKFSIEIENTLQTNNFLALTDSEIDSNFILKELIPIKALATTNSSNLKLSNTLIHTNNICL